MLPLVFVRSVADRQLAQQLAMDLERSGFQTRAAEPGVASAFPSERGERSLFVVVFPHGAPTADGYVATLAYLRQLLEAGAEPILIVRELDPLPSWVLQRKTQTVIRTSAAELHRDQLCQALLGTLFAPLPPGISLTARPSVLQAPVGVAWWEQDLFVSDEHFGHLVRIEGEHAAVVLPGLDEPQQIFLDRRKLLVANKGADQILLADVKQGGGLTGIRTISRAGGRKLCRPTSVAQAHGRTVIADTDHHRVVCTSTDLWQNTSPRWTEVVLESGYLYPCGVCSGPDEVWIADTFNQRIVVADPGGSDVRVAYIGKDALDRPYPVALAITALGDILIVSDETRKRVQFLKMQPGTKDGGGLSLRLTPIHSLDARSVPIGGRAVPFGTPCGLSVNRDNRLALVDRERACIWKLNLDQIPELQDNGG